MKADYSCLTIVSSSRSVITPIIINRGSVNNKLHRMQLKEKWLVIIKIVPLLELVLETFFIHNRSKYYFFFFLVYIVKCVWNLLLKNNYFEYPQLTLHTRYILEVGTHISEYINKLYYK